MAIDGDWERLAWQGYSLRMPADWEPARIEGDERQGYLTLDDGGMIRLEVSYRPTPRKLTAERAAEQQLAALARSARKRRLDFQWERKVKLPGVRGQEFEVIRWVADVQAFELMRLCGACGRMMLVRVQGPPGEKDLERVAARVFASLVDHPKGDRRDWRLLRLEVRLPVSFHLTRWSLRAGCTELEWSDGTSDLLLARVSLGRKLLREMQFVEWTSEFGGARYRGYDCQWSRTEYRGHLGVEGVCELPLVRRLMARKLKRCRKVRAWFCDSTDKIFVFEQAQASSEPDRFDELCRAVSCHE